VRGKLTKVRPKRHIGSPSGISVKKKREKITKRNRTRRNSPNGTTPYRKVNECVKKEKRNAAGFCLLVKQQ